MKNKALPECYVSSQKLLRHVLQEVGILNCCIQLRRLWSLGFGIWNFRGVGLPTYGPEYRFYPQSLGFRAIVVPLPDDFFAVNPARHTNSETLHSGTKR